MRKIFELEFKAGSHVPKYRQIIDSVNQSVREGTLVKGDKIPSLNELCKKYELSQDTVLMAYNELKSRGIITSSIGKGYFISNTQVDLNHKVFLLFDKLTGYKETLYEAFKAAFKGKGNEQIFFHNNNPKIFQTIVRSAIGEYSEYVIMPIEDKDSLALLELLPNNKVFILDQGRSLVKHKYPYVCQDFERDIYRIFKKNEPLINKYKRFILVTKNTRLHYKEIIRGFSDFCKQHPIEYSVLNQVQDFDVRMGDAFVIVDDRDLVFLVKHAQEKGFTLGVDLGLISYNEIPLKEIIAGGITTISTDFTEMGKNIADMVLLGKKEKIDNPFIMVHRNSF